MKRNELEDALDRIFSGCVRDPDHLATLASEVEALLERGVHPDRIVRPEDKWPLLACMSRLPQHAYDHAYIALYQSLVAHGARVNKPVRGGHTPLSLLCGSSSYHERGAEVLLKCLMDAGAEVDACKEPPICSLIGFGSLKGEVFGAPLFHEPGTQDYDAFWSSVTLLLNAGTSINAFERRGLYNPLLMAAMCGTDHALRRLIELGADPQVVNKDGNTALMYAAGDADGLASIVAGISCAWMRRGDTVAVARTLLKHRVDPALCNLRKRSALGIALRNKCFDVGYVVAEALSARGLLTREQVRGFKGSSFEATAAKLATSTAAKKAPAPKDTSGTAQLATWAKLARVESVTDFASIYPLVRELLDVSVQKQLYVDTSVVMPDLYLSTTKSWISRKGCIQLRHAHTYHRVEVDGEIDVQVTTRLMLSYETLNQDGTDMERHAEQEIPQGDTGMPNAAVLKQALTTMLKTHLGVVSTV